jgi:hypothetical protein
MPDRNAKGLAGAVTRGATGVAGETLRKAGSTAREATGAVPDATGTGAVQAAGEQVQATGEAAGGAVAGAGRAVAGAGAERTLREELRAIVREAAVEVLVPVARKATRQAATYAVKHGPELARGTIAPKVGAAIEEAGGPGALAKSALSSLSTARGAEAPPRPWRERPLPLEQSIDVVVPLEAAYRLFMELDEYANLLSRGEAVEDRPGERIEWMRTDREQESAVITFHRLSDRLTRVMVTYDHEPQGILDRAGALLGTLPRALTADLMRFKAFAEMTEREEAPEEEPRRAEAAGRRRERPRAKPTAARGNDRWQESTR